MVKKILFLFSKEISGLHQAAYLLAFFTLISQILALVRDRLLAHTFGASSTLDIYYAAFRIPDIILVFAASVVSISILVPFLVEKINESTEIGHNFIKHVFTSFFIFIIFVSTIVFFLIPYITNIVFPGIDDPKSVQELIMLTRILLLSPIILGLSNLFSSILQVFKRFFTYAIAPVLYNVGIIIGIIFLYPIFGIKGLAFGAVLGALMHFFVQVPIVIKRGFLPAFVFPINLGYVKKIIWNSLPRTFTLSTSQLSILILLGMASVMQEGSISIFNFSNNLQSVPLALIGASYSLAVFPMLSKFFSDGDRKNFLDHTITAVRHIIFWSLPITIMFIVLRAQIVRTILGSGSFSWSDTKLTAASLAIFVVSAVAQGLILLFIRGYYASGNTKKPLLINTISAILIIVFSFLLTNLFVSSNFFRFFIESLFKVEWLSGSEILMLPLAYTLGTIINMTMFWFAFQKDFGKFYNLIKKTLLHSFSASIILGFVAYKFLDVFDNLFDIKTLVGIFMQGLLAGVVGIIFYIIVLKLLKNIELEEVLVSIKDKIWKINIVAPGKEEL
ncbi:oligosaccharide flippase family protein [Patescibacteria group bacterium]|nr:oligosaccharide flippase family protein [Patescibacteria group bacterium]MBU4057831.1 oligosaccharide flippase family protein [Patescibacteria group bacterium]MBU4116080.1 oligosaccharide flippase family protein [Patescibacteria group bacterium]